MKVQKVLNRENQKVVSNTDTRDTKLEFTTKTLDQTRPANEQYVFNEEQYLSMIETLAFLNEKAEKEILNLNKITRMSKEEAERIEQKARALRSQMLVPNLLLTEYKDDVKNITAKYESGISKMKQLITSKSSSLSAISGKIAEIKATNRELNDKIQAIDKASLDFNIFSRQKITGDQKKSLHLEFEQLLLNEKQKNAIFNRKIESLELEQANLDNKLKFLEEELTKQKKQIETNTNQKISNTSFKRKTKEELNSLNTQISKYTEEIKGLNTEIGKNQEYIQNSVPNKQRLENQITNLLKDINDLRTKEVSQTETILTAQIEVYKGKIAETKSQISIIDTEINNLDMMVDNIKDISQIRTADIKLYMDDIAKLEENKSLNLEEADKLREEVRKLKQEISGVEPIFHEISEIISDNKKYELDLVDKYNQKKDQQRIAFQASKVCCGDKLKNADLQISTLKKLIDEQLARRNDKENILNKTTRQPDFDWKKLTSIIDLKTKISKTKASILAIKSRDTTSINEALITTASDLDILKTQLQNKIAVLKRQAVAFESEHRVRYDVKTFDYDTKLRDIRSLIQKRKYNISKLEAVLAAISNNSILINPEKSTFEAKLEHNYNRQLELQSKEIEEFKKALNEYSSN